LETTATVSCEKLEAGWNVIQSHLYVRGTAPTADAAVWEKTACPILRLLNTTITMDATVEK